MQYFATALGLLLAIGIIVLILTLIKRTFKVAHCNHHNTGEHGLFIYNSKKEVIGKFVEIRCKDCNSIIEFKAMPEEE